MPTSAEADAYIIELGNEFYDTLPDYADMVDDDQYMAADDIDDFVTMETAWFKSRLSNYLDTVASDWEEQRKNAREE